MFSVLGRHDARHIFGDFEPLGFSDKKIARGARLGPYPHLRKGLHLPLKNSSGGVVGILTSFCQTF